MQFCAKCLWHGRDVCDVPRDTAGSEIHQCVSLLPSAGAPRLPIGRPQFGVIGTRFPPPTGSEASAQQRARVAGKELDQISLSSGTGLLIKALEMCFDRALADAEGLGDLRRAASDLHDGKQDA